MNAVAKAKEYDLEGFSKDIYNIESQFLNLIYDNIFDRVVERYVYEKSLNLTEWKCAICGTDILSDTNRIDADNFICSKCRKKYGNTSVLIDRRIMDSRTKFFKNMEEKIYNELECNIKGRT